MQNTPSDRLVKPTSLLLQSSPESIPDVTINSNQAVQGSVRGHLPRPLEDNRMESLATLLDRVKRDYEELKERIDAGIERASIVGELYKALQNPEQQADLEQELLGGIDTNLRDQWVRVKKLKETLELREQTLEHEKRQVQREKTQVDEERLRVQQLAINVRQERKMLELEKERFQDDRRAENAQKRARVDSDIEAKEESSQEATLKNENAGNRYRTMCLRRQPAVAGNKAVPKAQGMRRHQPPTKTVHPCLYDIQYSPEEVEATYHSDVEPRSNNNERSAIHTGQAVTSERISSSGLSSVDASMRGIGHSAPSLYEDAREEATASDVEAKSGHGRKRVRSLRRVSGTDNLRR